MVKKKTTVPMLKLSECLMTMRGEKNTNQGCDFFKRNPEGSFFDGADAMEQFKGENYY